MTTFKSAQQVAEAVKATFIWKQIKVRKSNRSVVRWRELIASAKGPKNPAVRHVLLTISLNLPKYGGNCRLNIEWLAAQTGYTTTDINNYIDEAIQQGWLIKQTHDRVGPDWSNDSESEVHKLKDVMVGCYYATEKETDKRHPFPTWKKLSEKGATNDLSDKAIENLIREHEAAENFIQELAHEIFDSRFNQMEALKPLFEEVFDDERDPEINPTKKLRESLKTKFRGDDIGYKRAIKAIEMIETSDNYYSSRVYQGMETPDAVAVNENDCIEELLRLYNVFIDKLRNLNDNKPDGGWYELFPYDEPGAIYKKRTRYSFSERKIKGCMATVMVKTAFWIEKDPVEQRIECLYFQRLTNRFATIRRDWSRIRSIKAKLKEFDTKTGSVKTVIEKEIKKKAKT